MAIIVSGDGTLDTVLVCEECDEELRYTFDGDGSYRDFLRWTREDAKQQHECGQAA
jgi:hypothetical protein